jgi:hypothetical protein
MKQNELQYSVLAKCVGITAVYAFFYAVFGGMARYGLILAHALAINNVPNVVAFLLFGVYYLHALATRQVSKFMLILLLLIIFYGIYTQMTSVLFLQYTMGFYIWGSFLLGVLVCVYEQERTLFKFMLAFWAISVFGVLLNYFVDYPWIGQSYEVAGTTMEVSRSWDAYGIKRLPGFSRDSFAVAGHILITCAYILAAKNYSRWLKVIVYILSCIAIFLTTSKTELGLIAALPIVIMTYEGLGMLVPGTKAAFHFARGLIVLLVLATVLMPLTLSTHKQQAESEPIYGFITGDTVVQRMTQMWPEAFDLLEKNGNPVFGRGIGGIGTGLSVGDPDPDSVNAADNLFVYIYVEAGAFLALPFFISFFLSLGYLYRHNEEYFDIIWILSFCVLGISTMSASLEEPVIALFLGFLVAKGYIRSKHYAVAK